MADNDDDMNDALVPGTPEVPLDKASRFSLLREGDDRDAFRHAQLMSNWKESSLDRVLFIGAAFLLVFFLGVIVGMARMPMSCHF